MEARWFARRRYFTMNQAPRPNCRGSNELSARPSRGRSPADWAPPARSAGRAKTPVFLRMRARRAPVPSRNLNRRRLPNRNAFGFAAAFVLQYRIANAKTLERHVGKKAVGKGRPAGESGGRGVARPAGGGAGGLGARWEVSLTARASARGWGRLIRN